MLTQVFCFAGGGWSEGQLMALLQATPVKSCLPRLKSTKVDPDAGFPGDRDAPLRPAASLASIRAAGRPEAAVPAAKLT
jgi:hypothetical protein